MGVSFFNVHGGYEKYGEIKGIITSTKESLLILHFLTAVENIVEFHF
jgi:hypothetical protein